MSTRNFTTLPYTEYTVADGHYDETRLPITKIVLHSSASNKQGLIDTFNGGTRMVSAHYGIDNQGGLMAFLEEKYTAYACGIYTVNQSTISVEHIDEGASVKLHTDAQYAMSAKLIKDICTFYNIPIDSTHIIPHSQVVPTACPNGLDVAKIIILAQGTPVIDDCPAKLTQVTQERDRLNKIIGEVKDPRIKELEAEVEALKNANDTLSKQNLALTTDLQSEKDHAKVTLDAELSKQRTDMLMTSETEKKALQQEIDRLKKLPTKTIKVETPLDERFKGKSTKAKLQAITTIVLA